MGRLWKDGGEVICWKEEQYKGMCEGYWTNGSIHQPSIDNRSTIARNNMCFNLNEWNTK